MTAEPSTKTDARTDEVFDAQLGEDPSHPQRALAMLARIENLVISREARFGRERLLDVVDTIGEADRNAHVADYRTFIRSNEWPNATRPSSTGVFFDEYERCAAQYVSVGFEALDFISAGAPEDARGAMFRRVMASEALRGQFGKRSPTGLDERLEDLAEVLTALLAHVGVVDPDAAITTLGTPNESALTAEALMLKDLRDMQMAHAEPPTRSFFVNAAPDSAAWRCLRRHCRWSVSQLQLAYIAHPPHLLDEQIAHANGQRSQVQREKDFSGERRGSFRRARKPRQAGEGRLILGPGTYVPGFNSTGGLSPTYASKVEPNDFAPPTEDKGGVAIFPLAASLLRCSFGPAHQPKM